MNAFSIVGKITEMPVLKETTNGLKTCELPVRVQRNFPNSDGVYENDDMVIEVWRGLAETVSASCKIGDYVGINGRIHSRKYQKDEKVYLNYGFVAEKMDYGIIEIIRYSNCRNRICIKIGFDFDYYDCRYCDCACCRYGSCYFLGNTWI